MIAVRGLVEEAQRIVEAGCTVDKGDKFGWTPRQLSVDLHGVDIFQAGGVVSLQSSVVPTSTTGSGFTKAHLVSYNGKPGPIFECITNEGPDQFLVPDVFGNTAMDYLRVLHHDEEVYKKFISLKSQMF